MTTGNAAFEPAPRDTAHAARPASAHEPPGLKPAVRPRRLSRRLRPSQVPVPGAGAALGRSMALDVLANPGRALAGPLKAEMEGRLGADLSDVRVHAGAAARAAAAAVGAQAYTVGSHVVIGDGGGDKRTLAHELTHVIQQRSGPVAGTDHRGGLRLSDPADPFERAAEAAAARVMSGSAPSPAATGQKAVNAGPLAGAGAPASAVIQRAFKKGPAALDGTEMWFETDTKTWYVARAYEADGTVVVEPLNGGERLVLRHDTASGAWESTPLSQTQGSYPPGDDKMEIDGPEVAEMNALVPGDLTKQPSHVRRADPGYDEQAEGQWTGGGLRWARLSTGFTVQVDVAPARQGKPVNPEKGGSAIVYSPEDVVATDILVGYADRPQTYIEPKEKAGYKKQSSIPQGRHTVAWSFLRRSFAAMAGMTVAEILVDLDQRLQRTLPLLKSKEGRKLLDMTQVNELGQSFSTIARLAKSDRAVLPVERWQAVASEAIRYYAQIYHLSLGATFTGKSTNRGEGDALAALSSYEESLRDKKPTTVRASQLPAEAAKLLDAPQTMQPPAFAFAVAHWVEMLGAVYPWVMRQFGRAIIGQVLNDPLQEKLLQALSDAKGTTLDSATVGDLLQAFGYVLPTEFGVPEHQARRAAVVRRYEAVYGGSSEFVAHVEVDEHLDENAGSAPYPVRVHGLGTQLDVRALTPDQVYVRRVTVSDKDRPGTQFGGKQQSHTVAWTLIREELSSFADKPLTALLSFLSAQFTALRGDVTTAGKPLVSHASVELGALLTAPHPIHAWQSSVSLLVKWYAHAHQLARSTTYADPRTPDRPHGKGEAKHMDVLRRNELSLRQGGTLTNETARVTKAAVKLLDVSTIQPQADLTNAVIKWKGALARSFPAVTLRLGNEIMQAVTLANPFLSAQVPAAILSFP